MSVFRRSRPLEAPASDDDEWDAAIWHAKMRAALLTSPVREAPAPARRLPPELEVTPPPVLQVPRTPAALFTDRTPGPRGAPGRRPLAATKRP
jgi:hypothetical protein